MTALAIVDNPVFSPPALDGFRVTATGLQVTGKPSYAAWEQQGDVIWADKQAAQWRTGDWLIAGEQLFGDDYMQALDENRYTFHSLENIRYVCKTFPQAERRANLSFSSHSECASLTGEHRKLALDNLASGAWNRAQVRAYKQSLKGTPASGKMKTIAVQPVNYYSDGKRLIVTFDCADVPPNVVSWQVKVQEAA